MVMIRRDWGRGVATITDNFRHTTLAKVSFPRNSGPMNSGHLWS